MPKCIEFALVLSRFYFSMLECYFWVIIQLTCSFTQCFLDCQAVCYIFFKNSQLLSRIYSGFSGSLSGNRCWVNYVHVGGLWCHISPWVFIQLTSNLDTMIFRYRGLLIWLFFKEFSVVLPDYSGFSGSLCMNWYSSIMYMSGDASLIVWVDWHAGSVSRQTGSP